VEQDALAIWRSVQDAMERGMQEALEEHGELSVMAVGITNQRELSACRSAACHKQALGYLGRAWVGSPCMV
jgi:hypothetical protein